MRQTADQLAAGRAAAGRPGPTEDSGQIHAPCRPPPRRSCAWRWRSFERRRRQVWQRLFGVGGKPRQSPGGSSQRQSEKLLEFKLLC